MSARDFALLQLDQIALPAWPARLVRKHVAEPRDARDLGLAEQLRVGVIKNLLLLQHLAAHHSKRPVEKIDPLVLKILTIGLYQLRFLDRIPPSAAVDQAVGQCRKFGRSSAAGFVNAVLRNATREADPLEVPLSVKYSHPKDLLELCTRVFSSEQQIEDFCRHNNSEPPTIVRLCDGATREQLTTEGVQITPHESSDRLFVAAPAKQQLLADWSRRGIAQGQDATSAAVVPKMQMETGMTVLDRCSGVGTKTIQIRELVGGEGKVFAIDPNHERCEVLRRSLADRGWINVGVIEASWMNEAQHALPKQFDRILVDAPCSNSGVLSRRPEARYRQSAENLKQLEQLQDKLLEDSMPFLKKTGLLLYSTCSIWPRENQNIVAAFLARHKGFELLEETCTIPQSTTPQSYRDGGYAAVLRRRR